MHNYDIELQLNERAYTSRGTNELDKDIKMLRKYNNKIADHAVQFSSKPAKVAGKTVTDLQFLLVAHPHPECMFDWVRLVISLEQWPDAEVTDMMPRSEKGDQPVKYTISDEKGISIEATSIKLGPNYTRKISEEHTVYFEKITVSGKGSRKALWDFRQQPHTRLHLENLMKLKVMHDSAVTLPEASFSIEANLKVTGWIGNIPLIGSKLVTVN